MNQQTELAWHTTAVIETQNIETGSLIALTRYGVRATVTCNGYIIDEYVGQSSNDPPGKILRVKGKSIWILPGKPMMYLGNYRIGSSWKKDHYKYSEESFDVLIDETVMPLAFNTSSQYLVPIICKLDRYKLETDVTDGH